MKTPNFFLLLISPPPQVIEDVLMFKKDVLNIIGHSYRSLHSIAHLTLLPCEDFHNESRLYEYEDKVSSFRTFNIRLKGFRAFVKNGVIFLNIEYDAIVCSLAERLSCSILPHITIARGLRPKDFDLTWSYFKDLKYEYNFTCNHVTVLKRSNNRWVTHIDLPLMTN